MPRIALALCLIAALSSSAPAQELTHIDGLGSIYFPNSGLEEAQEPFVRGVLLLHSFEYAPAAAAFREAQEIDPEFALAFWGEAMTYNHPLWRQKDAQAAHAVLERLGRDTASREAMAGTEREIGFLRAVEVLYGPGTKEEQDMAYMRAMKALHEAYPGDQEARTFYALSILGSKNGERDFATYMRAAATAQPVFDSNPDHPGAAHYIIHSFDDPVHAPLGLKAANAYSAIAPNAAHAQHMTSHIFVALGLWERVVAANINASRVQNELLASRGRPDNACGHYSSWLHYGYLMLGEYETAEKLMDACHAQMIDDDPDSGSWFYFVSMRARHVVDSAEWELVDRWKAEPPRWKTARLAGAAGVFGGPAFTYHLTNALASLRMGAEDEAAAFFDMDWEASPGRDLQLKEFKGLLTLQNGVRESLSSGLELLTEAAAMEDALPFEFGPPSTVMPTHEALGLALLDASLFEESQRVFRRALERTPGRSTAEDGLARASNP